MVSIKEFVSVLYEYISHEVEMLWIRSFKGNTNVYISSTKKTIKVRTRWNFWKNNTICAVFEMLCTQYMDDIIELE